MKFDKWTVGLATAGVVSLGSVVMADESALNTMVSGTTFSGYVDTSAIYKPGVQNAAYRFVNTAPNTYNGFNFNVAALTIEKPLEEGQWSAGYKASLWFGPQAAGLPGALGGDNFGVQEGYVVLRAPLGNGLDIKIGQINSIIGYEVLDSYANPNFSRSLGFNIQPFSHTGMTATYQVTEWMGIVGGIADSTFNGTNVKETYNGQTQNGNTTSNGNAGNGKLTYMGAVTLKAPESMGALAGSALYGGIVSNGQSGSQNSDTEVWDGGVNSINYYVGVSVPTPIKEVTVGASFDYLSDGNGDGTWATAVAGYVSWQITEKLRANTRVEFAKANYNAWALGPGEGDPVLGPSYNYTDGFVYNGATRLFATTFTLDYQLWKNVTTRMELVWDHDLNGSDLFSSEYTMDSESAPGNYGLTNGRNNSVLIAANIIYKF